MPFLDIFSESRVLIFLCIFPKHFLHNIWCIFHKPFLRGCTSRSQSLIHWGSPISPMNPKIDLTLAPEQRKIRIRKSGPTVSINIRFWKLTNTILQIYSVGEEKRKNRCPCYYLFKWQSNVCDLQCVQFRWRGMFWMFFFKRLLQEFPIPALVGQHWTFHWISSVFLNQSQRTSIQCLRFSSLSPT